MHAHTRWPRANAEPPRQRDLFHPDCDRRPWLRTRSADPGTVRSRALAGSRGTSREYRRWGIPPRPENAAGTSRRRPGHSRSWGKSGGGAGFRPGSRSTGRDAAPVARSTDWHGRWGHPAVEVTGYRIRRPFLLPRMVTLGLKPRRRPPAPARRHGAWAPTSHGWSPCHIPCLVTFMRSECFPAPESGSPWFESRRKGARDRLFDPMNGHHVGIP
jgi:hypothetical protein